MKRISFAAVLSLVFLSSSGCSNQDPGQPSVGSISVKSREDDASVKLTKKTARSIGKKN